MPLSPVSRPDDRRRRLLQGELLGAGSARPEEGEASTTERASTKKLKPPRYSKAADMSQQARITDLVPQRKLTLWLLFLFGAAVVTGLECLYFWMPKLARLTRDGRVAAFDLDGEGSLGAWFSSLLLLLSALAALLVYTLRRHRLGDYRGGYRVWLWAAACWFVMSVDEAGSLHEGFKELMTYLTGNRLYGDGSVWWVMAYGGVLGLIGLVVLWDLRECAFAATSLVLTALCYAAAVLTQLGYVGDLAARNGLFLKGARAVMIEEGCEMAGDLLLLLAMVSYARFLIRDIQGLNKKKSKKKRPTASKPSPSKPAPEAVPKTAAGATASASASANAPRKIVTTSPQAQKRPVQPQTFAQHKTAARTPDQKRKAA
jgi:hypothetical protein